MVTDNSLVCIVNQIPKTKETYGILLWLEFGDENFNKQLNENNFVLINC